MTTDTCPICHTVTGPLPVGQWCPACEAEWIVTTASLEPGLPYTIAWEQLRSAVERMMPTFNVTMHAVLKACTQAIAAFADVFGAWPPQRRPNPALAFQRRRRGHRHGH